MNKLAAFTGAMCATLALSARDVALTVDVDSGKFSVTVGAGEAGETNAVY